MIGSAIVGEVAIWGGKKVYTHFTTDVNAPVVEEVEGDFWTDAEIARGYRNKDMLKYAAGIVGIALIWKYKKRLGLS
jgi:hypothetical protein